MLASLVVPALPLAAQDQPQPGPSAGVTLTGPLQIQESPSPASPAAPSLFAPDAQQSPQGSDQPPAPTDQAPSQPPASPADPLAPPADSGMGSPGQNPPPSDPNSLIPPPVEPEQPSPINAGGNDEKQRQEQKTRYYSAKVKADKDDDLASLLEKSDKAKSDEAKRQALRQYYDLLAKRMKKIDPSLSDWIDTMHSAYLRRLAQVRIEPTIPLNPPQVADAASSPSPTPKKKRKAEAN